MAGAPNLTKMVELFEQGSNFEMTDAQYEKKTGKLFPKGKSYLCNKSAVARCAHQYGYRLEVIEKTVKFIKE